VTHFFQSLKQYPKQYYLPILSGFLVGTSFPPFPAWASLFCWVPLWYFCLNSKNSKEVFWAGWTTQFLLTLIGFHWVAYTGHAFANLPWILSIPVLLLFAAFVHIHIPLALVLQHFLFRKLKTHILVRLLSLALLHSLLERVWPMIFPWHLGYGWLYSRLEIFQLADKFGFLGLSALLLIFNAFLTWAVFLWKDNKRKASLMTTAAALFVFLGLNVAGSIFKNLPPTESQFNVLIVQANIGQFDKIQAEVNLKGSSQSEVQQVVMERYFKLTDEALAKYPETEVIVWPETALADYLDLAYLSRPRALRLRAKVREWNRALLTGAYSREAGTDKVYNGFFVFDAQGNLTGPGYRKSHLLAFGERLPFGDVFPWLYKILPFVSSFQAGHGPQITPLPLGSSTLQIAPQICYESLFPQFSTAGTLAGAQILVNVTNDSWFGTYFEPYQHATMTWARAIENRRPLIRSTNTGQSSVIDAEGRVLMTSPLHQEWFGMTRLNIPPAEFKSFYTQYGNKDWIVLILILLALWGGSQLYARNGKN
jgi:apolipoprotein N-acyltransferase